MYRTLIAAALALVVTTVGSDKVEAKTIITGGSASVEVSYPLLSLSLWGTAAPGSPPATIGESGNPILEFPVQRSRGATYTRGSQAISGGYNLILNGGLYLFPLDADGNELESFETTADGQLRTCCRNAVTGLSVNTKTGELSGRVNGVNRPDNVLFTLGETTSAGTELIVTQNLAELLSYGFSAYNPYFPLVNDWAFTGQFPDLTGQSIGYLNYSVETVTAPIPVPAALPLLGGGIAVLGAIGHRRKKKAAA